MEIYILAVLIPGPKVLILKFCFPFPDIKGFIIYFL